MSLTVSAAARYPFAVAIPQGVPSSLEASDNAGSSAAIRYFAEVELMKEGFLSWKSLAYLGIFVRTVFVNFLTFSNGGMGK